MFVLLNEKVINRMKIPELLRIRFFIIALCCLGALGICMQNTIYAQTYRVERFQDGRPLRQGKFLISAGWSFLGLGYSIDPLGIARNPASEPVPEDPSLGVAGISGSFGVVPFLDAGLEISGGFGGPSFAGWLKSSLLPYDSPWQIAVQTTLGNAWSEKRVPVEDMNRPLRLVRSSLLTTNVSLPMSYDFDNTWTIMFVPQVALTGYRAGVGFDSIAPNGLNVSTLAETNASGWFYGFSIGAKAIRPSPEWWQYLLPVPFWASGSMMLSFMWHQSGSVSASLGYQHLFPSFGTLLATVTQEEMDNLQHERKQKDSIVALQKQQLDAERSRSGRALSAEILTIKGIYDDGKEESNPTLQIEEFAAHEIRPLLAAVYFEHNSFVIPTRYKRLRTADRMSFSVENIAHLRLVEMYRNILNIIGKRMTEKPDARITLTGYTSGLGEELTNLSLAERRANAVVDYLADVWKIATNRITVVKGEMQSIRMNTDTAALRRVEIRSDDPDILRPVEINDMHRTIAPSTLVFGLDIASGVGVKQWTIELSQVDGNEVRTLKIDNGSRSNTSEYRWNILENPASAPNSAENVVARLEVTDLTNRVAESSLALVPVRYVALQSKRGVGSLTKDVQVEVQYRWLFGQDKQSGIEVSEIPVPAPSTRENTSLKVITPPNMTVGQVAALNDALKEKSLQMMTVRSAQVQRFGLSSPEERIYANIFTFEYHMPISARQ